ncbi:hypothetical protein D3C76_1590850 [compost metagenome]
MAAVGETAQEGDLGNSHIGFADFNPGGDQPQVFNIIFRRHARRGFNMAECRARG